MPESLAPRSIVGLVPAAGRATRIRPLPCSKEILPVGLMSHQPGQPRAVCEFILEAIRDAGAERAYLVLRDGKWDIPAYLGDGHALGLPLGYLLMRQPHGVPYTLNQAHPFVGDATVLLGFPDIVFKAEAPVFPRLLHTLDATGAAVALGLFPTERPEKGDMVDTDAEGRVRDIVIKSETTPLRQGWVVAAWTPVFTDFLRHYVREHDAQRAARNGTPDETHVGHALLAALDAGHDVRGVPIPDGRYIDIGTPDQLATYASGRWT